MQNEYKGYEILKLIAEGKIETNTKFKVRIDDYKREILIFDGNDLDYENDNVVDNFFTDYCLTDILNFAFKIVEEINIQDIEEYEDYCINNSTADENVKDLARKYNQLLRAIKKLDKKISNKEVQIEKS